MWRLIRRGALCLLIPAAFSFGTRTAAGEDAKTPPKSESDKPAAVQPTRPAAGQSVKRAGLPAEVQAMRAESQAKRAAQARLGVNPPDFVGPPFGQSIAAKNPAAAKPGADIPQPTVILKPGEVPGIRFDTPIYDFGKIRSGPDVEHDYWFTNTGTGPLEILRVKPS